MVWRLANGCTKVDIQKSITIDLGLAVGKRGQHVQVDEEGQELRVQEVVPEK